MPRVSEIRNYIPGSYAADPDIPILQWWKVCTTVASWSFWFIVLIRTTLVTCPSSLVMAHDILAIPSVAVERLLSCRIRMSEEWGALIPDSASKPVIKEWLKAGLSKGLDYLDGVAVHGRK